MNIETIFKKLMSRKFIAMLLGVALGCAMVFGVEGEEISTLAGAVTSIVSLVYYMFTEGKIDKAALFKENVLPEGENEGVEELLEELYKE